MKLARRATDDIAAVAVDRSQNPDVLHVGTANEGVHASTDGGETWGAKKEGLGNLAVTKLAIGGGPAWRLYAGTK
jgi:hypothetical protein